LRLDANLFHFPPPKRKGPGRRPIKGKPHKKLLAILKDRNVAWTRYRSVSGTAEPIASSNRNRHRHLVSRRRAAGADPLASRPRSHGELDPQAFLATDLNAHPGDILAWFVTRWQVEVTFEETRVHLGVETQRQWSDKAILRTTPALLALFSIVTLWTHDLAKSQKLKPRAAAWYPKIVSNLQRCHRGSSPRNMDASDFFHVPAAPRPA